MLLLTIMLTEFLKNKTEVSCLIFEFKVLILYPFNVYETSRDDPFFMSDVGNLCLLSYFLVSLAKGLSNLLVFSKNRIWVSLTFLYWCPVFNFIDFFFL